MRAVEAVGGLEMMEEFASEDPDEDYETDEDDEGTDA